MTRRHIHRIITLLVALLFMFFGVLGTALGLAFLVAHLSLETRTLQSSLATYYGVGIFAFCFGCLCQYLALYLAWIRPRRKPINPETS